MESSRLEKTRPLFRVETSDAGSFRLAGITFRGESGGVKENGLVSIGGGSTQMRVDHIHIDMQNGRVQELPVLQRRPPERHAVRAATPNDGTLDACTATNTWTDAVYTPYTYPHPLVR